MNTADQRSEDHEKPEKFDLIALCSEAPAPDSTWSDWNDPVPACVNGKTLRFRECDGVCAGKSFEIIDCETSTTTTTTSTTVTGTTTTTTRASTTKPTMTPGSDGCLVKNFPEGLEPKKPEELSVTADEELIVLPDQRLVVLCGDGYLPHMNKNYAKATCTCSDEKCSLTDFSREITVTISYFK